MDNHCELKRIINLPGAIALYIGAVLGSGVLIVPGIAAEIAGPASLLAWGGMTLLVMPLALSMGLLSAKFPNAGGVSHFVTKAFGAKAGSLVGWFFLMSVPIGMPVVALTGAGYLTAAMGWGNDIRVILAAGILAVGLFVNLIGMKVAAQVQIAVEVAIIFVLVIAIFGSEPYINSINFKPFMPHGWVSIGQTAAILFWCFSGWEAVSHLSEEFLDPKRTAIRGVLLAAIIIGLLYFLTAFVTIGTHSYQESGADVSLVLLIKKVFGYWGALIAGLTGVSICTATIIAYVGAASRLAYALARKGDAPRSMGILFKRYGTPIGGLTFLALCFLGVLSLYLSGAVSLTTLIQLPNATVILTYLGGCASGIRLLKGNVWGVGICWLSFISTVVVFPFVGWAVLYPLIITIGFGVMRPKRNEKSVYLEI